MKTLSTIAAAAGNAALNALLQQILIRLRKLEDGSGGAGPTGDTYLRPGGAGGGYYLRP